MTAALETIVTTKNKPRGRRKPPSPNSVLDPEALRKALDEANLSVKPTTITAFYQALHRQGYPSLPEFVQNYEVYNQHVGNVKELPPVEQIPLRNRVTVRKNRNKTQLSKAFLNFLKTTERLKTLTSKVLQQQTSRDGTTTKLAIELHDGSVVESVLMRYANPYSSSGGRASLCVSSQVGCAMGCTFCATGTMGLYGNLTTGEILEQIVHADKILAAERIKENCENNDTSNNAQGRTKHVHAFVRNVVFMGMGEPLDNFNNVTAACRALIHPKRWNLAHHSVTVSTVGLVSQIRKLTAELPQVSLALSLHAPNQAARQAIVPTASRYPIEQLVEALDHHMTAYQKPKRWRKQRHGDPAPPDENVVSTHPSTPTDQPVKENLRRRAMIEYVMLEGPTSSLECAHELGQLCQNRQLLVNLIPYNSTNVKDKLQCPSEEHMQEFRRIVASYRVFCTIRRTMGADIDSACGQLVQQVAAEQDQQKEDAAVGVVDIEDVAGQGRRRLVDLPSSKAMSVGRAAAPAPATEARPLRPKTLEDWIFPLSVATAVSASCFLASLAFYLKKPQRR